MLVPLHRAVYLAADDSGKREVSAALVYALIAAGANLAGGLVVTTSSLRGRTTQRLLTAFGAGFMLAVAMLAMLPHALEQRSGNAALAILLGYLLVGYVLVQVLILS